MSNGNNLVFKVSSSNGSIDPKKLAAIITAVEYYIKEIPLDKIEDIVEDRTWKHYHGLERAADIRSSITRGSHRDPWLVKAARKSYSRLMRGHSIKGHDKTYMW